MYLMKRRSCSQMESSESKDTKSVGSHATQAETGRRKCMAILTRLIKWSFIPLVLAALARTMTSQIVSNYHEFAAPNESTGIVIHLIIRGECLHFANRADGEWPAVLESQTRFRKMEKRPLVLDSRRSLRCFYVSPIADPSGDRFMQAPRNQTTPAESAFNSLFDQLFPRARASARVNSHCTRCRVLMRKM